MNTDEEYEYVGELSDTDDEGDPVTFSVYSCPECHGLVVSWDCAGHWRWHKGEGNA